MFALTPEDRTTDAIIGPNYQLASEAREAKKLALL